VRKRAMSYSRDSGSPPGNSPLRNARPEGNGIENCERTVDATRRPSLLALREGPAYVQAIAPPGSLPGTCSWRSQHLPGTEL
jgi:hypothetical protein